ncbi:MAG TPA: Rieske (2Fe-2S) protein [Vitreimonas sp.]|nr:Rieske (2Fe-2S) protein [Vitreimonas sp.]
MSGDGGDDQFIKVGHIDDAPPGQLFATTLSGKPLVVTNTGHEFVAFPDMCLHYRVRLSEGTLEDGVVTCRWHQWKYCPASGDVISDESPYATFTTFPVVVADNGDLLVSPVPRTMTTVHPDE